MTRLLNMDRLIGNGGAVSPFDYLYKIMDDLMDTLQVANPRVYNGVMRKIRAL